MENKNVQNKLQQAIECLQKMKALDGRVIEVTKHCSYADYFILVSATSSTHAQSISDALENITSFTKLQPEGYHTGQWILNDLGDVIVHIFQKDMRSFYQLDKLWAHAPSFEIDLEQSQSFEQLDQVSTL